MCLSSAVAWTCACVFWQEYIARFGHGSAKLARQAQSKEKTLKKMVEGGLTEKVSTDKVGKRHSVFFATAIWAGSLLYFCLCKNCIFVIDLCIHRESLLLQFVTFYFPDCGKIPPPVISVQNVSFQYNPDKVQNP